MRSFSHLSAPHGVSPRCHPSSRVNNLRRSVRSDHGESLGWGRPSSVSPSDGHTGTVQSAADCSKVTVPSVLLLCQLNSAAQHLEIIRVCFTGQTFSRHYKSRMPGQAHQSLSIIAPKSFARHSKPPLDLRSSSCKRRYPTQNQLQVSNTKEHIRLSTWEAAAQICMSEILRTTQLLSQKNLSKALDKMRAMLPFLCFLRLFFSSNPLSEGLHLLDI